MRILTIIQAGLFLLLIGYAGGYEVGGLNDSGILIRVAFIFGSIGVIHIIKIILRRCLR